MHALQIAANGMSDNAEVLLFVVGILTVCGIGFGVFIARLFKVKSENALSAIAGLTLLFVAIGVVTVMLASKG